MTEVIFTGWGLFCNEEHYQYDSQKDAVNHHLLWYFKTISVTAAFVQQLISSCESWIHLNIRPNRVNIARDSEFYDFKKKKPIMQSFHVAPTRIPAQTSGNTEVWLVLTG